MVETRAFGFSTKRIHDASVGPYMRTSASRSITRVFSGILAAVFLLTVRSAAITNQTMGFGSVGHKSNNKNQ